MAVEIIMPKLGVDMQEGEIIEWKIHEGDEVKEGEILLVIMSDKTHMEIEAEDSGVTLIRFQGQALKAVFTMKMLKALKQLSLKQHH